MSAAEVGNTVAMGWVGDCYRDGNGAKADEVKAREWHEKAIAAGFASAGQSGSSCAKWFASLQAAASL